MFGERLKRSGNIYVDILISNLTLVVEHLCQWMTISVQIRWRNECFSSFLLMLAVDGERNAHCYEWFHLPFCFNAYNLLRALLVNSMSDRCLNTFVYAYTRSHTHTSPIHADMHVHVYEFNWSKLSNLSLYKLDIWKCEHFLNKKNNTSWNLFIYCRN